MAKRAEEIKEDDLAGAIRLVFLDNRRLYRIVSEQCVSTNAYYRQREDMQEGRPILAWDEYLKAAKKRFVEMKITIVSLEEYNEYGNEHICGKTLEVINFSNKQRGIIKSLCFEAHDHNVPPSNNFNNVVVVY